MTAKQIIQLRNITRLLCGKPHLRYVSIPRRGRVPTRSIIEPVKIGYQRIDVIV